MKQSQVILITGASSGFGKITAQLSLHKDISYMAQAESKPRTKEM